MRSNSGRAKFAIVSLYTIIAGSFLYSFVTLANIYYVSETISGEIGSSVNLNTIYFLAISAVVIYLITYLICGIAFILWFTRAYRNIQVLMPNSKFHYKPWAAAVCWFIPVWNIIGPYNIASNLFDKTERHLVNEERMNLRPKYDIVKGWWWALWIMSAVVIRMSEHYTTENPLANLGRVATIIGFMISILCAFFAIRMIRNYREMELLIISSDGRSINYSLSKDDLLDSGI